jgi:hypothetical protein
MFLTHTLEESQIVRDEMPGLRFAQRTIPIQIKTGQIEFQTTPFTFKIKPELMEAKCWTLDALSEEYRDSAISVAIGPRIGGHLEQMTVPDAIQRFKGANETQAYARQIPVPGPLKGIEQREIFSLIIPRDRLSISNLWIGPKGTIQPFHKDNHHPLALLDGVLLQLHGSKEVLLVSNEYDDCMYPRQSADYSHHSSIDMSQLDGSTFPRFKNVEVQQATLEQGNGIFIPGDTWHHVRSLSCSVSMSVWWHRSAFVDRIYRATLTSKGVKVSMPERLLGILDLEEVSDFHQLIDTLTTLADTGRQQFTKYCDANLNARLSAAGK